MVVPNNPVIVKKRKFKNLYMLPVFCHFINEWAFACEAERLLVFTSPIRQKAQIYQTSCGAAPILYFLHTEEE